MTDLTSSQPGAAPPINILTFTSLYPNNVFHNHGIFVKERMTSIARLEQCRLRVVAPVPYFPPVRISQRWKFSQVLRIEHIEGQEVRHPRYLMTPKVGMSLYGFMMFLCSLPTLRALRRRFDFDIIDSHYVYPDGFAAVLLGKYFGRPVTVSARGSDINLYGGMPVIRPFLRYTLDRSSAVIAVSRALKEAMMALGTPGDKIHVIPNGVDAVKFHPLEKQTARSRLALPPDRRVILSVGGLVPLKRFDLQIRALKVLEEHHHNNDVILLIAGDGPERKSLADLALSLSLQDRVRFAGQVPQAELYLYYSAADVSCLTSIREGWPNVVLESFACGTPVLASKIRGVDEIVCDESLGMLTEVDPGALAGSMKIALDRQWDGRAIRAHAMQNGWDKAASSVLRLFGALTSGRAQDPSHCYA